MAKKERPKGLLDAMDDLEAERKKRKQKRRPKDQESLDLDKVWGD